MPPKLSSPAKPVARAESNDKVASLRIPTPEELGLGSKLVTGNETLDWTTVERKLDAAGVTAFQVEKTASGFQFVCRLAKGDITGRGTTRVEAIRQALAQLPN
jgi:hypothetical protein